MLIVARVLSGVAVGIMVSAGMVAVIDLGGLEGMNLRPILLSKLYVSRMLASED